MRADRRTAIPAVRQNKIANIMRIKSAGIKNSCQIF
jgi:hypothetical protein